MPLQAVSEDDTIFLCLSRISSDICGRLGAPTLRRFLFILLHHLQHNHLYKFRLLIMIA